MNPYIPHNVPQTEVDTSGLVAYTFHLAIENGFAVLFVIKVILARMGSFCFPFGVPAYPTPYLSMRVDFSTF